MPIAAVKRPLDRTRTQCGRCNRPYAAGEKRYPWAGYGFVCADCVRTLAEKQEETCPCCGFSINAESMVVGMLMTPAYATEEERKNAAEVQVLVCPSCRNLFLPKTEFAIVKACQERAGNPQPDE